MRAHRGADPHVGSGSLTLAVRKRRRRLSTAGRCGSGLARTTTHRTVYDAGSSAWPELPGADADRRLVMAWSDVVLECLKANKVQTLVHVPDTILTDLIRRAGQDDFFDVHQPDP